MGKFSRDKGVRWELQAARDLTASTSHLHCRVLEEVRDGNSGDVRAVNSRFLYQCKSGAAPRIFKAVTEAVEAAGPRSRVGVAAIHRTGRGGEKLACLRWSDWLDLLWMVERVKNKELSRSRPVGWGSDQPREPDPRPEGFDEETSNG